MASLKDLRRIAEVEFADIVKSTMLIDYKMRVILKDNSFLDVYLSRKLTDKFGFHWECMDSARTFFRYDNFPDRRYQNLTTYPFHFHAGSHDAIEPSTFPPTPIEGFRAFMEFIRSKL
jgi:hypothetical protein